MNATHLRLLLALKPTNLFKKIFVSLESEHDWFKSGMLNHPRAIIVI